MASTLALMFSAIAALVLPAAKAGAACESYYVQLGQQGATYTYLSTSGGQTQEISANMSYMQGAWKTISIYDEEGPVQAGSSFRIMCTGRSVAAELSHSVSSAASPQSVTTNGAGQFCVTALGSPSTPLTIQVDIKRVILPSNDAVGTAIMGSYDINIDSRSWFTSESAIYVIQPGESLPIIKVNGKLTLTSVGSITARTTVIVTLVDCDGSLRDADVPDDPDDDEADLDPDEYIRLRKLLFHGRSRAPVWLHPATGNVSTVVPVFETFANDATELDFQLRHDSQRAAQDGPLGYGWTHSYHIRIAAVNGGPPVRCQKFIYWTEGGRRNAMTPWVPNQCSYFPGSGYMRPPGRNFDVDWPEGSNEPRVFSTNGEESVFDTAGRLKRVRDKRGRTTYFLYDSSGRLITIISPHGRVATLQYQHATDPKLITKIIDPDQKETTFTYDSGNLKTITNPLLQTTTYEYDGSRRITKTTVENAPTWHAVYTTENIIKDKNQTVIAKATPGSGMGLPADRSLPVVPGAITYTEGCDRVWSMERDRLGRSFKKVATNAAARQVEYGGLFSGANWNRLIKTIDELGGTTQYEWTTDGYVASETDALNNVTRYYYEEDRFKDLVTKILLPGASEPNKGTWEYDYDNDNGDLLTIKDPIRESPDKIATLVYETHSPSEGIPSGYAISGLPSRIKNVTVTDRNGHVTIYEYNLKGCMTKLTRGHGAGQGALNLVTNYEYDNMGRRTKEIVERPGEAPIVTEWTYDALGRERVITRDPGGLNLVTARQYDALGNLTQVTDPRDKKTKFEYDERNRLWKQIEAYGELNLTTEWQYDCRGNLGTLIDPNQNPTTFLYDVQDHLTQATDAENYKTTLGRDAAGRLVRLDRYLAPGPNATSAYTVLFSYDKLARPMLQTVDPSGLKLATRAEYLPPGGCTCNPGTPGKPLPYKLSDPAGSVTFLAYDNLDRRTRIVRKVGDQNSTPEGDTDDAVTQILYDAEGNRTSVIGPENEQIVYEYDAADRQTKRIVYHSTAGTLVTQYGYDPDDNLRTVTLPNGNVRTLTYDLANRQVAVNDSVGAVVMYSYDQSDNVIREADGIGRTTRYDYDAVDRVIKVLDPIVESPDLYTEIAYDGVGNRTQVTDNNGVKTLYAYDKLGRLVRTTEDYQTSPPQGSLTYNTITTYSYNGAVQTAISDHENHTTTYGYDAALRMTSTAYPSPGGQVSYTYTGAGKLYTRTDQRGIVTTYTYDDLHQLTGRSYSTGPSEAFAFDRSGRLTTANNAIANLSFTYDRAGRSDTAVQAFVSDSASYTVDHDFVVAATSEHRINYPGGRLVRQDLDARARLKNVVGGTAVGGSWGYDAADQRSYAFTANVRVDWYTYDADGRLTNINYQNYDGTAYPLTEFSTAYGYDAVGNRTFTRWTESAPTDRSELYAHDRRNRLTLMERGTLNSGGTAMSGPLTARQEWSNLDRRGNWLEYKEGTGANPPTRTTQTNAVNQYTSLSPGGSTSYDAAGNLTLDPLAWDYWAGPAGLKYEYDEENRLKKVRIAVNDNLLAEYKYDAAGRRVETVDHWTDGVLGPLVTRHVYNGLETIQEYVCCLTSPCASGVPTCGSGWALAREFVWGDSDRFPEPVAMIDYTGAGQSGSVPSGGLAYHYLRDVLGSVIGLTNASGNLVERYTYDPYGKPFVEKWNSTNSQWVESIGPALGPASAFGNPWMWTGQRYDAIVGLYHFYRRGYSPFWGRWMQTDPLGYVDGMNLFQYLAGMPLAFADPFGLSSKTHGSGEGWRIDSEVIEGRPGNVHYQTGNEKYYYDPRTQTFFEEHTGARMSSRLNREILNNREKANALRNGVNRVRTQGNGQFRIGPKTFTALSVVLGLLIGETTEVMATVGNGKAYHNLLKAIHEGDLEAAERWAQELYDELVNGGHGNAALDWLETWEKVIKPKMIEKLRERCEFKERKPKADVGPKDGSSPDKPDDATGNGQPNSGDGQGGNSNSNGTPAGQPKRGA